MLVKSIPECVSPSGGILQVFFSSVAASMKGCKIIILRLGDRPFRNDTYSIIEMKHIARETSEI